MHTFYYLYRIIFYFSYFVISELKTYLHQYISSNNIIINQLYLG